MARRRRKNLTPNVSLRQRDDGTIRPRYTPGPLARAKGEQGRDLRRPNGSWYTLAEVIAWCKGREDPAARIAEVIVRDHTVAQLLKDWLASDDVKELAEKTRDGYTQCVDAVCWRPQSREDRKAEKRREREEFSKLNVGAIDAAEVKEFYLCLKAERGWHQALACVAAMRAAFSWGRTSTLWRLKDNPCRELGLARPPGRIVIYTDAEIRALVAACDAVERASIGDATTLGLFSGQRQGDRLALEDNGLVDGRRQLRQSKTGAVVALPETPQLRARLEHAKARVAAIKLKFGARPTTIVVDETTGRAYNEHTFRHVFAEVRELAIAGSAELGLAPCPSLEGKRDQDLRDTAVTWLARASCTLPEIASITGHSPRSIHDILKHYLALTPELADSGIAKLVAWMEREGVAL